MQEIYTAIFLRKVNSKIKKNNMENNMENNTKKICLKKTHKKRKNNSPTIC